MYTLEHVGIVVEDVDKSTFFYTSAFGCEVEYKFQDERLKAVFLTFKTGTIELLQYFDGDKQNRDKGVVDHIAFHVDDMEEAIEKVKAAGGNMVFDSPKIVMGGKKRIMFLLGPDGERLELVQNIK